jgi:Putative auto-transporter adhesin, head GIN domain
MMKLQGSGTLAVRTMVVSSFTRLHLSVHGTVHFVLGDDERVEVEADDNLLDYVQAINSGRTLFITSENKLRSPGFTVLRITVYLRQLAEISIACDGDVVCPDLLRVPNPLNVKIQSNGATELALEAPALTISIASDGDTTLRGAAGDVQLKAHSHGSVWARELITQHLTVTNKCDGNVEVYAEQTIAAQHMGNGYLHYGGPARLTDVRASGSGPVRHV